MNYYRVTSNKITPIGGGLYTFDNINSYRIDRHGRRVACQYIPNELLTAADLKTRYGITPENVRLFPFLLPVTVNKNNTYFCFGARFEYGRPLYFDKDGAPVTC